MNTYVILYIGHNFEVNKKITAFAVVVLEKAVIPLTPRVGIN